MEKSIFSFAKNLKNNITNSIDMIINKNTKETFTEKQELDKTISNRNSMIIIGSMCSGKTYFTNSLIQMNTDLSDDERKEILGNKKYFMRVGFDAIFQDHFFPFLELLSDKDLKVGDKHFNNLRDFYKDALKDFQYMDKINRAYRNFLEKWEYSKDTKQEDEEILTDFFKRLSWGKNDPFLHEVVEKIFTKNDFLPCDFVELINNKNFEKENIKFLSNLILPKIQKRFKIDFLNNETITKIEKEEKIENITEKLIKAELNNINAKSIAERRFFAKQASMLEITLFLNSKLINPENYYIFDLGGGQTDYRKDKIFSDYQNMQLEKYETIVKNIFNKTNLVEISPIRKPVTKEFKKMNINEQEKLIQNQIDEKIKNSYKRHKEKESPVMEFERKSIIEFEKEKINYNYNIKYNFATYEDDLKAFVKEVIKDNERKIQNIFER